jgi:hypothetical protein
MQEFAVEKAKIRANLAVEMAKIDASSKASPMALTKSEVYNNTKPLEWVFEYEQARANAKDYNVVPESDVQSEMVQFLKSVAKTDPTDFWTWMWIRIKRFLKNSFVQKTKIWTPVHMPRTHFCCRPDF